MPFIHVRTNREISPESEKNIVQKAGDMMPILGKSREWLMVQCEDNCRLYFHDDTKEPVVFVHIALFGKASQQAYDDLTQTLTQALAEILHASPDHIYIQYEETSVWGWNGSNF